MSADTQILDRRPDPDDLLMRLDQNVRRFQIDYERFLSGNLPMPPEQLRIKIQNQIKEMHTVHLKAVAHRFRFNSLEAKFNALLVLYNRRLREHESGRGARTVGETADRLDAAEGVVVGKTPSNAAVAALYQGLYSGGDSSRIADLDKFRGYIKKQAEQIRQKTGCSEVRFRVSSEGGKVKLKAKPVGE